MKSIRNYVTVNDITELKSYLAAKKIAEGKVIAQETKYSVTPEGRAILTESLEEELNEENQAFGNGVTLKRVFVVAIRERKK